MLKFYIAKLVGLKDDFVHDPNNDLRLSIFEASKEDYGDFIFTRTIGGYKEFLTGKTFKYQEEGYADDGYPYYIAPKKTGLFVDKNTARKIPKPVLKETLIKYSEENSEESLLSFFDETQKKCDEFLNKGIVNEKNTSFGPKK